MTSIKSTSPGFSESYGVLPNKCLRKANLVPIFEGPNSASVLLLLRFASLLMHFKCQRVPLSLWTWSMCVSCQIPITSVWRNSNTAYFVAEGRCKIIGSFIRRWDFGNYLLECMQTWERIVFTIFFYQNNVQWIVHPCLIFFICFTNIPNEIGPFLKANSM